MRGYWAASRSSDPDSFWGNEAYYNITAELLNYGNDMSLWKDAIQEKICELITEKW